VEEHVSLAIAAVRLDQDHPVRPDEFIAEGLGAVQHSLVRVHPAMRSRTRLVRSRASLWASPLQAGNLYGEHHGGVLDGHPLSISGRPGPVVQDEHGYRGFPSHRDQAVSFPDRARGGRRPVQEPVPLIRVGPGIVVGPPGPAQASRLPKRSSMAAGRPVSS
jgi:hypothetical protein